MPADFYHTPIEDLKLFVYGRKKAQQDEWERARFIASAMADVSKIRFPWEQSQGAPKSLKKLDKNKIDEILKHHGVNIK